MKNGKYIIWIAVPVLCGLFCLLGWNCREIYRFEKRRVQEKVETCIKDAADKAQWYNGSLLNSYALMLTDKDYSSKVAFAAGFTHNRGKMSVYFFNDDTIAKSPGADTNIISKSFLKKNHIAYKPSSVMTIRQFDSLFRMELKKNKLSIPYRAHLSRRSDSATNDSIISAPFILDFTAPHIYCVRYVVPGSIVISNISAYLVSTLLLCLFMIAGTVFYYRSYRMQGQLAQFRESLFGNVTHELKTPLSSLQLIVENAEKNISSDPEVAVPAEHILFAKAELNRMKLLIDRILSFSKMSREQLTLNKQQVNLAQAINDAIDVMGMSIKHSNTAVITEIQADATILGDPMLITNVVAAIIDNALKYTNRTPEIHIRLTHEALQATIAIRDNGIGIPKQYCQKIFEPFFRISTGDVHNTSGHGLGLSFAKQVVTLHGGSISCTSSENGSTFYIQLDAS